MDTWVAFKSVDAPMNAEDGSSCLVQGSDLVMLYRHNYKRGIFRLNLISKLWTISTFEVDVAENAVLLQSDSGELLILSDSEESTLGLYTVGCGIEAKTLALTRIPLSGQSPTSRSHFAAEARNDMIWIHGGITDGEGSDDSSISDEGHVINDMYSIDLKTATWINHGQGPKALCNHSMHWVCG